MSISVTHCLALPAVFRRFARRNFVGMLFFAVAVTTGCAKSDPIVTYSIPTEVPEQLRLGTDRMLAAMLPSGDQIWFFKVTGPEQAIGEIEPTFREFVRAIQFNDGQPVLTELPDGWRRGSAKPMRFATIDVETTSKQLGISVSQLARQDDWDEQVKMNVNRWRGQLGLRSSDAKWAEGEEFELVASDANAIWVDLRAGQGGGDSTPPFADRFSDPASRDPASGASAAGPSRQPSESEPDPRLNFERPEGWRDGQKSRMRLAAFDVGPEDSSAELTIIPAGGDLRGNVARWLGQIREGGVPDEVVDQALADAKSVDVDGRPGQRFILTGDDAAAGNAIDVTVVPIDGGISLFVKMTGPAKTVTAQSEAVALFLESLELNL